MIIMWYIKEICHIGIIFVSYRPAPGLIIFLFQIIDYEQAIIYQSDHYKII